MNTESNTYQRTILVALNQTGRHIYGGTVPAHVKASRRAANKVARQSRRVNRGQR
jgi:hypothetical protein